MRRSSIACSECQVSGSGELPLWLAAHNNTMAAHPLISYDRMHSEMLKSPDTKSIATPGYVHSFGIHSGFPMNGGRQGWKDVSDDCGVFWLHMVNLFGTRDNSSAAGWEAETRWHWLIDE